MRSTIFMGCIVTLIALTGCSGTNIEAAIDNDRDTFEDIGPIKLPHYMSTPEDIQFFILNGIRYAREAINIGTMILTDQSIIESLVIAKAQRPDLNIRVLVDNETPYWVVTHLRNYDIFVYVINGNKKYHEKFFTRDYRYCLLMSSDLSVTDLNNYNAGVLFACENVYTQIDTHIEDIIADSAMTPEEEKFYYFNIPINF